jgi:methylated-DNA-protein-cysteine methyltransferase-like protein
LTIDAEEIGDRETGRQAGSERVVDFDERVAKVVRSIRKGTVASSYGQVAASAGAPRGARAVVQALNRLRGLPWWRVIRSDGTLAPEVATEQARRLRAEGVVVRGRRVEGARPIRER